MGPKLFGALELAFAGVLLVVVLYIGGVFNEGEPPIPAGEAAPLPTNAPPPTTSPATTPTAASESTAVPTPRPTLQSVIRYPATPAGYQIVPGDTCIGIAVRFNISLESLIAANNLDAECRIIAGGQLVIPIPPPTPTPAP